MAQVNPNPRESDHKISPTTMLTALTIYCKDQQTCTEQTTQQLKTGKLLQRSNRGLDNDKGCNIKSDDHRCHKENACPITFGGIISKTMKLKILDSCPAHTSTGPRNGPFQQNIKTVYPSQELDVVLFRQLTFHLIQRAHNSHNS